MLTIGLEGLTVTIALAILFSATFESAHAQQHQQDQLQQQTGSDGVLAATLNSDSFSTGDTITVNGTVQERESNSYVSIEVYDPQRRTVERELVPVNEGGEFTHSFVAGAQAEFDPDFWMQNSGTYRMAVRYTPPGLSLDRETVEFAFNYNTTTTTAATASTASTSNNTVSEEPLMDPTRMSAYSSDNLTRSESTINLTAINQSAVEATRYTELAYMAVHNNNSRDILANLSLALDELYGIQGNLTMTQRTSLQNDTRGESTDNTTRIRGADDAGNIVTVSISPGPSGLTDVLFQPNPIRINIGDRVQWVNQDSIPHTVTSSQNITAEEQFDSGVIPPNSTFEHTFTKAGEYLYSCTLHPNHAGTVLVS
jgi:plastocyanin